jgi:hypothetical protein
MAAKHLIYLEMRGGQQCPVDLAGMEPLGRKLRDWTTGVDLVDILLPVGGGTPVIHTYSRWFDGKGGEIGDRYFEPDDATLVWLGDYFDEPALLAAVPGRRAA